MNRDFTFQSYRNLCLTLTNNGFIPINFEGYLNAKKEGLKYAIIRHDVDKRPKNALEIAKIEADLGIKSTFYFRTTKEVFKKKVIAKISELGHEIGYHYEVLAKSKGNKMDALELFKTDLDKLRKICKISTICMHGSPMSSWRDADLWIDYDFTDYKIVGEPYITLDFDNIYYYTDTGRRWDGNNFNVRDRVKTNLTHKKVKSTEQLTKIIPLIDKDIMINTHPQRWNDSYGRWLFELVGQNIKNVGKKHFLKR